ncbi:MAG TPA: HAD-IC family P-type ATPase [Reyranella sp.]|nr:HAD-IC family P-type ATPase [Reyranella sp.]
MPLGLTAAEAARRLAQVGPNATPDPVVHPLRQLLGKFIAPVPCLLEAAIALQLVLGEYIEAAVIAVLLVFNAALGFFHEGRAQATIAALKSRLALSASVRRDGQWVSVAASDIVPGDIVKVSLGSIIVADMRLLAGEVMIDQSMITGESLPVEAGPGFETYAGALVRRGEALAKVTATGARTKFGRTAELVSTAHVTSTQQKAILRVVINLAAVNGVIAAVLILYGWYIGLAVDEFIPLVLLAMLATVPVALPATFTLATAIGARALARQGVLPTRLSAVDEAASMDVLCTDKTGTLTRNELAVTAVRAMPGFDEAHVVGLAALASSDGGQDPVDQAVRAAARRDLVDLPRLATFLPFDPATKTAEATVVDASGARIRVVKGAFATVAVSCEHHGDAAEAADSLQRQGYRVLGVAVGTTGHMRLAGLLALSDPPRPEAAACIAELRRLGVEVVIVTGDAPVTAGVVAKQVGVSGAVHPPGPLQDDMRANKFEVFAGVLPEDKFRLVAALQQAGHTVGMCGDGANDAPALRQAQMGIAVSTATDVAKSAAGIVLTEPGLSGIVASVREGRVTFQRILTYTLRSIVHKVRQVLFLAIGLVIIRHSVLTPMMMVLSMITGDFLAMSATTDNVEPSPQPNVWRINSLTIAGAIMGFCDLAFCTGVLIAGKYWLGLPVATLQTLTLVMLVFNGQAVFYVVRERRRLWSSRPSTIVLLASLVDLLLIPTLAFSGILMAPLAIEIIAGLFAAAIVLAFTLDFLKVAIFRHLRMV